VSINQNVLENLKTASQFYEKWLKLKYNAKMEYLERHFEIKQNPEKFLESVKSVLCFGFNYGSNEEKVKNNNENKPKISLYTRGLDYHLLLNEKLDEIIKFIKSELPIDFDFKYRKFVDSAPNFDRFWGTQAGLGWIGKNTCLINRKNGSYFFVVGFFTNLEFIQTSVDTNHCGRCTKCIEACPTNAIEWSHEFNRFWINSNKCIGYHTIENKEEVPSEVVVQIKNWIAGCDVCQSVCPWNEPVTSNLNYETTNPLYDFSFEECVEITKKQFDKIFKSFSMSRMKYFGFLRNISIAIHTSSLDIKEKIELLNKVKMRAQELSEEKKNILLSQIEKILKNYSSN